MDYNQTGTTGFGICIYRPKIIVRGFLIYPGTSFIVPSTVYPYKVIVVIGEADTFQLTLVNHCPPPFPTCDVAESNVLSDIGKVTEYDPLVPEYVSKVHWCNTTY